MILAVDIGNSNIVLSAFNNGQWGHTFRYETKGIKQEVYYEIALRQILMEWKIVTQDIRIGVISSVVPDLNEVVQEAIFSVLGCPTLIIGPSVYQNLDMNIPHPYEIGADLVANAYSALAQYGDQLIIADFGTALSFVVVDKKRGIIGVTIAPGLKTAAQSLSDQTAQLPVVPLEYPASAMGKDTVSAIQAGIMIGYLGLFKEIVNAIKDEVGYNFKVILTGGHSTVVEKLHNEVDNIDKMLTLEGMRLIGEYTYKYHPSLFSNRPKV
ncbi:MAG: type III pantothenate kinase [Saprospiraceae bacterium]